MAPTLTDTQQRFISSTAIGPVLGPLYFLFLGIPRMALLSLILRRAIVFDIKHGRQNAWAAKSWDSFAEFQSRNEQIDQQARFIIIALCIVIGLAVISILSTTL